MGRPKLTAEKVKKDASPFPVPMRDGTEIMVRKLDIASLMLSGAMPLDMLSAIDAVENAAMTATNPLRMILTMPPAEREATVNMMRAYAVAAAVDPKLSPDFPAPDGEISVYDLSVAELVSVWAGSPPDNAPAAIPEQPPVLSGNDVKSFRSEESNADRDAVSASEDVQPSAESLDHTGVDAAP